MSNPTPNRITIALPFSFKGETLRPSSTIDLDEHMGKFGSIPCLYTHIAEENHISPYSYEHDVMMMAEMEFEKVEGIAARFVQDGKFDSDGFEAEWKKMRSDQTVREIAQRQMEITDLDAEPKLKKALLDAYEAGKSDAKSEKAIRGTTDPLF